MPVIFFAWTRSLIRVMTFSGPTPYGSSVTTMPVLRAFSCSIFAARPGAEDAAAGRVRLADAVQPDDPPAGRQVGAGDEAHELFEGGVRVPDQVPGGGDDLGQVVRGHVRGHPDRDARGAVDQQVGDRRGQDLRLLLLAVVVRAEVDGVLVDVPDHRHRGLGGTALGVPHRGRGVVAAEAAEVPVAVHQRQPHGPRLGEPDQGVVDRAVAVRVQAAHDVADDAGALDVPAVGPQAHRVHLVEDSPLHRLETVPGVGQRAGVDDAVGVLEVRAAHLLGDVDIDDVLFELFRWRRGSAAAAWWHAGPRLVATCRCGTGRARWRRRR